MSCHANVLLHIYFQSNSTVYKMSGQTHFLPPTNFLYQECSFLTAPLSLNFEDTTFPLDAILCLSSSRPSRLFVSAPVSLNITGKSSLLFSNQSFFSLVPNNSRCVQLYTLNQRRSMFSTVFNPLNSHASPCFSPKTMQSTFM